MIRYMLILMSIPLFILNTDAFAQGASINTSGNAADTSAMLDVSSTTKGMLVPRMTETNRSNIVLPATGLLVYQTDGTSGFYYNSGTPASPNWVMIQPYSQAEYAYIYNLTSQIVPIGVSIIFDHNGYTTSGIFHPLSTSQIFFASSGVYKIEFSISAVEPNQFEIRLNGSPVPGSKYGSGAGTQQNTGTVILNIISGDIIELYNSSSYSPVTLSSFTGGTDFDVNASIIITKL